jgi:hypothetical protein
MGNETRIDTVSGLKNRLRKSFIDFRYFPHGYPKSVVANVVECMDRISGLSSESVLKMDESITVKVGDRSGEHSLHGARLGGG